MKSMTSHFKSTDLGTKFLHQHSVFVIEDLGKNILDAGILQKI